MSSSSRTRAARTWLALGITVACTLSCTTRIEGWIEPRVVRLEVEGWHELTSPDFILYSRGPREDLESFAVDLARYIAVVEQLVEAEPPKTPGRIVLVEQQAEALLVPYYGHAGYINWTLAGFSSFVRAGRHDATIRSVLLHEYTHYLTFRNTRLDYPTWYTEGFAEFLGPIRARGDVMEVGSQPPGRLQALEGRKNRGERIDLEKIFAYKRGSGNPAPGDLYPIAWASVHYLNADPKRQKQLVAMVEAQANGVDWKTAYSKAFSQSIEDLSQKVEAHAEMLNRGVPGAVLYIPLDELEVRTDWTVRSLEPIEVLRLFGEFAVSGLIAHSKEYNRVLARTLLNRALEFSPNDSRIHAGLASTAAQESDFETADLHLARFAADSNPSATAIVHAAFARALYAESLSKDDQAEERKAAHQAAITLYQRALEREPENAFALAGLGRGWLATEAFDRAREPLARAQSLGEWDAELTLDRALVEKELGFSEEARRLWLEVVRLGSPEQAKKAAALIKLESLHAGVSSGEENK